MTCRVPVLSGIKKTAGSFAAKFVGVSKFPKQVGVPIMSSTYELAGHSWYICIYPGGIREEANGYLSCYLHIKSNNIVVRARYSLSILNNLGVRWNLSESAEIIQFKIRRGYPTFVSWDALQHPDNGYCINDTITILAEITVCDHNETTQYDQNLLTDLRDLFHDKVFADVTIIAVSSCGSDTILEESTRNTDINTTGTDTHCLPAVPVTQSGKRKHVTFENTNTEVRIAAHKCILSMRSPVFRAMFTGEMAEAHTNEVRILDFDAVVVKEFLQFLYTNRCHRIVLQRHIEQLLAAACKYQVSELQTQCENYMVESITATNVISILSIAELYNTENLKLRALCYIARHAKEVVQTEGFFDSLSPELHQLVVRALAGVLPQEAYHQNIIQYLHFP